MRFLPTSLPNAFVLEPELHQDERGFFARTWCAQELAACGLTSQISQCSISFNRCKHTLRGMHYQAAPREEAKVVRCTQGAIYDVIVDLRPGSATRCAWFGIELTAGNRLSLFVPMGFAHGFLTLTNDTEVFYQISEPFDSSLSRGVRYDDPSFGIDWPASPQVISERDRTFGDFRE